MNQETGEPQRQDTDSESGGGHTPIAAAHTTESEKDAPESAEHCKNAAHLRQATRWNGFKKWFSAITIAEVGMLLLTAAIAASSFFYTKYAKRQWRVMSGQLTEMQNANRSWVGLSGFNIGEDHPGQDIPLGQIVPDAPIGANAVLENFGKTPAQIDELGFQLEVRSDPVPEDFRYSINKRGPTLFPSQTMQTSNSDTNISVSDFNALKKHQKPLVFHGKVEYRDALGHHTTKFCLVWSLVTKLFNTCLEHGSTD